MTYHLRIADLPTSDRPREKLIAHGSRALTAAELIAILLGTGQGPGKLSAVGLGQYILQKLSQTQSDALVALRDITPEELMEIPGVGPAKATTILAALELGKRVFQARPGEQTIISDPSQAAAVFAPEMMWETTERFGVLLLDVRHRLLGHYLISMGSATETIADPKEIFREVIRRGGNRMVIAHNHPSGNLEPSQSDIQLTRQLLAGAQLLGIPILDHLILGLGEFRSLRQTTALWQEFPQGD
jgi:DNA repair protein RadC